MLTFVSKSNQLIGGSHFVNFPLGIDFAQAFLKLRSAVAVWYGADARSWVRIPPVAAVYQRKLSVPSRRGRLMSTSESWWVNGHTTIPVSLVLRLRLVSGSGLQETEISGAPRPLKLVERTFWSNVQADWGWASLLLCPPPRSSNFWSKTWSQFCLWLTKLSLSDLTSAVEGVYPSYIITTPSDKTDSRSVWWGSRVCTHWLMSMTVVT